MAGEKLKNAGKGTNGRFRSASFTEKHAVCSENAVGSQEMGEQRTGE